MYTNKRNIKRINTYYWELIIYMYNLVYRLIKKFKFVSPVTFVNTKDN